MERNGQMIDRALLKDISKMFSMLEIYGREIEEPLIEQSEHFFRTEAQQRVEQLQKEEEPHAHVADFLELIESRLHEEMDRVRSCLEHKTQLKLVEIVERLMIRNHVDVIVDHGFKGLMAEDRYKDITRMHRLLEKAGEDAMKKLKQAWGDSIRESVSKIIQEDKENRENSKVRQAGSNRSNFAGTKSNSSFFSSANNSNSFDV
jgi:cullin-4